MQAACSLLFLSCTLVHYCGPESVIRGTNSLGISQPLLLFLIQLIKLFNKSLCCRRTLEEIDKEALSLVIPLSTTTRLFVCKSHELLFAEAAAEVDKRIWLIFPITIVRAFVFGELGGCGGLKLRTGGGLKLDDENFEDLEGGRDNGPLIWICGMC
jgi:hypothetical protein